VVIFGPGFSVAGAIGRGLGVAVGSGLGVAVGSGLAVGLGVGIADGVGGTALLVTTVGLGVAVFEQATTASSRKNIEPIRARRPVRTLSSSITLVSHPSGQRRRAQGSRLTVIRA
jgi:hypothetical protein